MKFVENIHVMRESLLKVKSSALNPSEGIHWLQNLDASRWMEYIGLLLASSVQIAKLIIYGSSVVVHCSDGKQTL